MAYCLWSSTIAIHRHYHDEEWGTPLFDDRKQFEFLVLAVMQCGLSFWLMLKKRAIFRSCFADYDSEKVACFKEKDVERIMATEGMIRSEQKIRGVINNAKVFNRIRNEFGSFSKWLWAYTDNKIIVYPKHLTGRKPVSNALSKKLSKDLRKLGCKYLGEVTMYSHLQACGIINDHDADCTKRKAILSKHPWVEKRCSGEVY